MTGLFIKKVGHFAVLTKFSILLMKSRPYWPGGGVPAGRVQNQGAVATGPEGWVLEPGGRCSLIPPTPGPAGLPGPASLYEASAFKLAGWATGIALPVPTQSPYPAWYTLPYTRLLHVRHAGTDCSYTRFDTVVGEPRGSRTHRDIRVLDGILNGLEIDGFLGDYD